LCKCLLYIGQRSGDAQCFHIDVSSPA
jgi:hypothetical protein